MKKILPAFFAILLLNVSSLGQTLVVGFRFDTACFGKITHFTSWSFISDTVYPPRDTIVSQKWDLNGDGKFDEGSGPLDSIIYTTAGIHSVGLKCITGRGVVQAIYNLVPVVRVVPDFTFTSGCFELPVVFNNKTVAAGDTSLIYLWDFGDGNSSALKNPTHTYTSSGQYIVTLTARIVHSACDSTISHPVQIASKPVLTLTFDGDTVMYEGQTLVVHVVEQFDSIIWSDGSRNSSITITKAGYYSVTGYWFGCYTSEGFHVTVRNGQADPVITTLFTPNGDGYNDRWEILNLSDVSPCQVNVFDRFGEEVLSSSDYKNDWDGTFKGKRLANDTYYYFVKCYNQVLKKGNVNILR